MNTKDIDSNIGMPDIDKEWKRFEKEVITRIHQPPSIQNMLHHVMG